MSAPTREDLLSYLREQGKLREEGGTSGRQARMDCPTCAGKKTLLIALEGDKAGSFYCHHAGCNISGGCVHLGDVFGSSSPWGRGSTPEPEESRRIRDELSRRMQGVKDLRMRGLLPSGEKAPEEPKPQPSREASKPTQEGGPRRKGGAFAFRPDLHETTSRDLWEAPWAERARVYLREVRGLSEEALQAFQIGALAVPTRKGCDDMVFVSFPVFDEREELVNVKFRPVPGICPICDGAGCPKPERGRPMCDRGKIMKQFFRCPDRPTTLAGVERLPDGGSGHVVIVEGEMDIVAAWDMGFRWGVVSGTAGAGTWRDEWTAALERFDHIVIAVDQDSKGDEGASKIAEAMGRSRCFRARFPGKDANECLQLGLAEEFKEAIEKAESMMDVRLVKVSHYRAYFEQLRDNPDHFRGIPTGWREMDRCMSGWPSGLTVLTGDTGEGKTTFASEAGHRLARRGVPVVITAFEQRVALLQKLLRQQLGGDFTRRSNREQNEAFDVLSRLPLYLTDQEGEVDASKVVSAIRYAARVEGVRWFLIDHLGYLMSGAKADQEKHLIDTLVRALAILGAELDVAIVLIAHPNRGNVQGKFTRRVTHKDLKGSSAIEQEAALILVVERGDTTSKKKGAENRPHALVHVDKVRTEFGIPGSHVKLYFDPRACRYESEWALLPIAQQPPGI